MKRRIYQGVTLSKKETEFLQWFELGSDDWQEAYAQYPGRRAKRQIYNATFADSAKSWFNSVLKGLHKKGILTHCPFAFHSFDGIRWIHPGFENSGFVSETMQKEEELSVFNSPVI